MATLRVMAQLAKSAANDEQFTNVLREIFHGAHPTLEQIDSFLRSHLAYQAESFEIVRTPQFMIEQLIRDGWFAGDCDCVSTLAAAILLVYDYPAKFVAIRYSHPSEFEHVFTVSEGFRIDATVPRGTVYKDLESMTLEI